ncbi:MAG: 2-dehydropantoate 2-reductase [Alphaproteobacteria bacterium]|jgi:2-dehydropantoate 2-reductase|nr:2-dehydropantoate 2-reductase [Alphaproteobacteria bacterium]
MAKIAIIGTGAMGSVYAGLLADAGHEIWAIDSWADHVEAMRKNGLRVEGASGDRVAKLNASTKAGDAGVCDLVIIATKAMDVVAAAESARPLIGPNTLVQTIQNGLGSADKVVKVLGPDKVTVGIVGGFGASMRGPGHVHHNGWEMVHIGELNGPVTPRLQESAAVWKSGGFNVKAYDDVQRMIWEKFICNVTFSASTTLTGLTIGGVIADPHAWQIAAACATEAWQVAKAKKIAVAIDEPVSFVRDFGGKIPHARPSMLLDHMAKRRCEIDVINGAVPLQAVSVGLQAPVNAAASALIRQREASFS